MLDFTQMYPDNLFGNELERTCNEVLIHRRELIAKCIGWEKVLQDLCGDSNSLRRTALWKIKGAALEVEHIKKNDRRTRAQFRRQKRIERYAIIASRRRVVIRASSA